MPDLIDRNELKNRLKWGWPNDKFVLRTINEMPTVEAEPVKHGRWVDGKVRHIKNGELRNMRECSECGACYFVYDAYNSAEDVPQYCPNCGARMDEGDDDETD